MLHYFNICLERWKTHQNPNRFGFACSAAGLFPFPFGGPFDGPLPGPLAATTGAWECIDTEDTENEYDWIWLNNMHLNETDANWIKLKLIGCNTGCKWTNHLQVSRGLWKDTFYILLSKLPEFTSHQLTNTIGKCSYVQLYHIAGLGTFFDLCDGLCFCLAWFWRCFFFGLFYGWSSLRTSANQRTDIHRK